MEEEYQQRIKNAKLAYAERTHAKIADHDNTEISVIKNCQAATDTETQQAGSTDVKKLQAAKATSDWRRVILPSKLVPQRPLQGALIKYAVSHCIISSTYTSQYSHHRR